jgi:hypothetical protein
VWNEDDVQRETATAVLLPQIFSYGSYAGVRWPSLQGLNVWRRYPNAFLKVHLNTVLTVLVVTE